VANDNYFAELAQILAAKRGNAPAVGGTIDTSVKARPIAAMRGPDAGAIAQGGAAAGRSLSTAILSGVKAGLANRQRALSQRQEAAAAQARAEMMPIAAATGPAMAEGGRAARQSAQARSSIEVPLTGTQGGPQLPPYGAPAGPGQPGGMPVPAQPQTPAAGQPGASAAAPGAPGAAAGGPQTAQPPPPGYIINPQTGQPVPTWVVEQAIAAQNAQSIPQQIPQLPQGPAPTTAGRQGAGEAGMAAQPQLPFAR